MNLTDDPERTAMAAMTPRDRREFEESAETDPRAFMQDRYGEDPTEYDSPEEFVVDVAGSTPSPSSPSGSTDRADEIAASAFTPEDVREFRESDTESPAAFLESKYGGPSPGEFDSPTAYIQAQASGSEGDE